MGEGYTKLACYPEHTGENLVFSALRAVLSHCIVLILIKAYFALVSSFVEIFLLFSRGYLFCVGRGTSVLSNSNHRNKFVGFHALYAQVPVAVCTAPPSDSFRLIEVSDTTEASRGTFDHVTRPATMMVIGVLRHHTCRVWFGITSALKLDIFEELRWNRRYLLVDTELWEFEKIKVGIDSRLFDQVLDNRLLLLLKRQLLRYLHLKNRTQVELASEMRGPSKRGSVPDTYTIYIN